MKNLVRVLLLSAFIWISIYPAQSMDFVNNLMVLGNYEIYEDIVVHENISFEAHDARVIDSLQIINFGEINGGINVCAGCVLTIENSNTGRFNADIFLQGDARVVQLITSGDTATNMDFGVNHGLVVRDAAGLNLHNIAQIAAYADNVNFTNVEFNSGKMSEYQSLANLEIRGDIILNFDDIVYEPVLLFSDTSGDGVVHVTSNKVDKLYAFQTYKVDQDIYVHLVRSTDYAQIFDNDMGRFLNNLRVSGIDNKLLARLDSAKSMHQIDNILNRSARTNPIKLMQPILLLKSHKTLETVHIDNNVVFGVEPISIYASDVFIGGIRPNVSFNLDQLYLKLSGYVVHMDYADDLNDYNAISFGVDADANYEMSDKDILRGHIGVGKSYFDIGPVFDGKNTVNNPNGISMYAVGEYAHVFDLSGGYSLLPFVGVDTEYIGVANSNDINIYGIGGTDVQYSYDFAGLRYDYSLRALIRTDGTFGGGAKLSVWSIMDAAGADLHIAVLRDNIFGTSYSASLNGRFMF